MRALGWIVLGIAGVLLLAMMTVGAWIGMGPWDVADGTMWHWGPMVLLGWLWMLLPLGLVALVVYLLLDRDGVSSPEPDADEREAVAIAERRYAAGEIDREAYLRILEDLDRSGRG